jgi:hypothetical protein
MKNSRVFRDTVMNNCSAVEAAIAALFCEGALCVQSVGFVGAS